MAADAPRRHRPAIAREVVQAALDDIVAVDPAVAAAYVFGSLARDAAGPLSDVDVALLVPARRHRQAVCDRTMDALCRALRTPHIDVDRYLVAVEHYLGRQR